jgi:hypothetical protein
VIRETWLTPSYNNTGHVRHAFLIGTTNGEILTSQVKQEDVDFGDIIQFSFNESYRDLTLNKGNNKITELRTILQRESQNS